MASSSIKPFDLVFDIGAFHGVKAKQYLDAGAMVVCVEPNESCIEKIRKRCGESVTIVNKAVGDKEGEVELLICSRAPAISTCTEEWTNGRFKAFKWNQKKRVPMTTLDALIQVFGIPDFIKIDTEGYEYKVLSGLRSVVPALSFEFAREFIDITQLCINRLVQLGYVSYGIALGKRGRVSVPMSSKMLLESIMAMPVMAWGDIYAWQT